MPRIAPVVIAETAHQVGRRRRLEPLIYSLLPDRLPDARPGGEPDGEGRV